MTYPKPFMGIPELMKMGLTREFLNQAIASPGQTFASRVNPKKKKVHISLIQKDLKNGD